MYNICHHKYSLRKTNEHAFAFAVANSQTRCSIGQPSGSVNFTHLVALSPEDCIWVADSIIRIYWLLSHIKLTPSTSCWYKYTLKDMKIKVFFFIENNDNEHSDTWNVIYHYHNYKTPDVYISHSFDQYGSQGNCCTILLVSHLYLNICCIGHLIPVI